MKQKIQDLLLLVQKDRKYQLGLAAAGFAVVFLMMQPPPQRRTPMPKMPQASGDTGAMSREEAYSDIMQRFSQDVETIKTQTMQNASDIKEVKQTMLDNEQRTAEIFKKILERIAEGQQGGGAAAAAGAVTTDIAMNPIDITDGGDTQAAMGGTEDLAQFGSNEAPAVAPPAPPPPQKVAFIGAGDSVRVKLLAGVNAPTDGTPYPVVFKLVSDVYGPDGSVLPLGEARLIAAAQGSLTDSRALFRVTTLNLRLPDGRRKVYPVDGWVVGEDGLRGMQGVLIDPIGKAIAGAGMAGGLSALGEGFAQSQTTTENGFMGDQQTTITGEPLKYAAGKTLGGFAKEWSGVIRDRVNQLVPHVQVLSGREATAVFAKSLPIYDLFNAMEEDDNVFASLD